MLEDQRVLRSRGMSGAATCSAGGVSFALTEHVPIRRGLRGSMWPALKGKREPGMEPVDTTINALELFVSMRDSGKVGHSLLGAILR
jgi:hypothetical protein